MTTRTRSGLSMFGAFVLLLCAAGAAFCATTIDVLLVYDSTATTYVNSHGGMSTFSANVIAKMNSAMANSGLDVTWRLAHAATVSYTYSGDFSTDLQKLQAGSGNLSQVHTLRDTYKADIVAMLLDTGSAYGWVGQGYLLTTYSGDPNYAFTVNAVRSVEISDTLTHEVGHNMGCHHSKYQASQPGPNSKLNSYSAGWYFTAGGTKYHTIMAYDDDGYGNTYQDAPLFSTPLRSYQGTVAGSAAHGDNARTINETKGVVAAYRSGGSVTPNPNAAQAYVCAYYGEYFTYYAYNYYYNYDYYGYLYYAYYYADYAHYYAYLAYAYDATYGDDYGFADYAALYAYYGYLYAWGAYSYKTGDSYSYNAAIWDYYAYYYSYLVSIGQH